MSKTKSQADMDRELAKRYTRRAQKLFVEFLINLDMRKFEQAKFYERESKKIVSVNKS